MKKCEKCEAEVVWSVIVKRWVHKEISDHDAVRAD